MRERRSSTSRPARGVRRTLGVPRGTPSALTRPGTRHGCGSRRVPRRTRRPITTWAPTLVLPPVQVPRRTRFHVEPHLSGHPGHAAVTPRPTACPLDHHTRGTGRRSVGPHGDERRGNLPIGLAVRWIRDPDRGVAADRRRRHAARWIRAGQRTPPCGSSAEGAGDRIRGTVSPVGGEPSAGVRGVGVRDGDGGAVI